MPSNGDRTILTLNDMKKITLKIKLGLLALCAAPFMIPGWIAGVIWQGLEAGFYFGYNAINNIEDSIDDIEEDEET